MAELQAKGLIFEEKGPLIILPTPERKKQTEAVNKGFTLVADD